MVSFSAISLRNGDRALLAGGSQSGKSTLAAGSLEYPFHLTLCGDWLTRYPDGLLLLADSKPRYRAAFRADGLSDAKMYKNWAHGPVVPGSTRVGPWGVQDMMRAFRTCRIVIVQSDAIDRDAAGVVAVIEAFRRMTTKKHKRMIYVDETMDFYNQSGMPLRGTGNVILRCARAGAERDLTTLLGAQRCKGIPPQFWELINKLYLYRMDMLTDMQRIAECGGPVMYNSNMKLSTLGKPPMPHSLWPPEADYLFRYWTKAARRQAWGPYTLHLAS